MEGQRPDGKVVRFDLLRIKRDSQLRCQCSVPRLELDPKNRTVQCKDCRAYLDPFDALIRVAERAEALQEYEKQAMEEAEHWRKLAEEQFKRCCRALAFREMESEYRRGVLPGVPCVEGHLIPSKSKSGPTRTTSRRAVHEAQTRERRPHQ